MPSDRLSSGDDDDGVDRWVDPETVFGDPEARFGDPESDLVPDGVLPTEDGDDAESVDFSDVDPDLLHSFVVILLLIKVGVILVSAGSLLIGFRGQLDLGGALVAAGVFAFARAIQHYRSRPTGGDDPADGDTNEADDGVDDAADGEIDDDPHDGADDEIAGGIDDGAATDPDGAASALTADRDAVDEQPHRNR